MTVVPKGTEPELMAVVPEAQSHMENDQAIGPAKRRI